MIRRTWHALKYFGAPVVETRAALEQAMARAPRHIIVLGDEALRADAAALAHHGAQEAALVEAEALIAAGQKHYPRVPLLGRVREGMGGYAAMRRVRRRRRRGLLGALSQPGMAPVLAAGFGLCAALAVEWLAFPSSNPELIRGNHPPHLPPRRGLVEKLPTHAPLPPPPSLGVRLEHLLIPILAGLAAVALGCLIWDAIRPGTVKVSWRVEYRIQGRLVIRRVRTRLL